MPLHPVLSVPRSYRALFLFDSYQGNVLHVQDHNALVLRGVFRHAAQATFQDVVAVQVALFGRRLDPVFAWIEQETEQKNEKKGEKRERERERERERRKEKKKSKGGREEMNARGVRCAVESEIEIVCEPVCVRVCARANAREGIVLLLHRAAA